MEVFSSMARALSERWMALLGDQALSPLLPPVPCWLHPGQEEVGIWPHFADGKQARRTRDLSQRATELMEDPDQAQRGAHGLCPRPPHALRERVAPCSCHSRTRALGQVRSVPLGPRVSLWAVCLLLTVTRLLI